MGRDVGCRVGEVRAGTTSPMPDHKGLITTQWEGIGDVGLARYEPALLLPCATVRALSYSNYIRDPPTLFLSEFSEI